MKRSDIFIILGTILYSLLFYLQILGLNIFIFSCVLTLFLIARDFKVLKSPQWLASAAGTIISGYFVFALGTPLPIMANILSLLMLAAFSVNAKSSFFVSALHGIYSFISVIPYMIIDAIDKRQTKKAAKQAEMGEAGITEAPKKDKRSFATILLLIIVPLIITFVFFWMYKASNPIFDDFTKNINLDFINLKWVRFTLLGFILVYGFFMQRVIKAFRNKDHETTDALALLTEEDRSNTFIGKMMQVANENLSGIILLALLNMLLLLVNFLDMSYLWINQTIPDGMIFSEYVHNGIELIIISIVLAILIILFYFRGYLNFYKKSMPLKILGFLWILQNIFMIASTAYRNYLYIDAYNLTHKRIGVFIWLTLAVVGLVVTFVKIAAKRNNWFLFRKNAWAGYAMLIIACFISWDMVITNFNIKQATADNPVALDKKYLAELKHDNTAVLFQLMSDTSIVEKEPESELYNSYSYSYGTFEDKLFDKFIKLSKDVNNYDWRSYCKSKQDNYDKVIALHEEGAFTHFSYNGNYDYDLEAIKDLTKLKSLDLTYNYLGDTLSSLGNFPDLEVLNLANNSVSSFEELPALKNLKDLDISGNYLSSANLDALGKLNNLEKLTATNASLNQTSTLPIFANLRELDLTGNYPDDISTLSQQPNLKILNLTSCSIENADSVAVMPQLEELVLNQNYLDDRNTAFMKSFAVDTNLTKLSMNSCSLNELYLLAEHKYDYKAGTTKVSKAVYPNIIDLDISANSITSIYPLTAYENIQILDLSGNSVTQSYYFKWLPSLTWLDMSNNSLSEIENILLLDRLTYLDISVNNIQDINGIDTLENLTHLDAYSSNLYDISDIGGLTELTYLDLGSNQIADFSMLKKLTKLETLIITENNIASYNDLKTMTHLKVLYVDNIGEEMMEELKEALPDTKIETYYDRYQYDDYYY